MGFLFLLFVENIQRGIFMQYLVRIGFGEDRERRVEWLLENGYQGNIDASYPYSVIIVDYERFFGGNVTCFAASCSKGKRILNWEDWLSMKEKGKLYC